ncbi:MAG: pilin [bacterium]|nr:pilin [bacterium]
MKRIYKVFLATISYSLAGLSGAVRAACDDLTGGVSGGAGCAKGTGAVDSLPKQIQNITNTLLFIIGIAAVIMLIVGGLMYIFSGGDSENTKKAKDTILYAVIGIVVALLSFAIVSFVIGRFPS